jgi:putative flippase GtrA
VAGTVTNASGGFLSRPLVQKLVRYSAASVAGVVTSYAALALFHDGLHWPAVPSNIASVMIGSIPNYLINRYWTWQRAGRDRMTVEITVFWVIALLGLLISTVFVWYADQRWDSTLALFAAQLMGFGILWVGRFIFLDKVLFRVVENIEHPHEDGEVPTHGQA